MERIQNIIDNVPSKIHLVNKALREQLEEILKVSLVLEDDENELFSNKIYSIVFDNEKEKDFDELADDIFEEIFNTRNFDIYEYVIQKDYFDIYPFDYVIMVQFINEIFNNEFGMIEPKKYDNPMDLYYTYAYAFAYHNGFRDEIEKFLKINYDLIHLTDCED